MKILVFNGSPKKERSDTMHITRAFLGGMNEAAPQEVQSINVADMHIEFCRGCFACKYNGGRCAIDDDMREILEQIQKWYFSLKFSPVVETVVKDIKRNPKRMQREAKKQMLEIGIGTKSQQALKLQQEQNKQERKEKSRKRKEAEEQRMFELKQRKKLEENAKK